MIRKLSQVLAAAISLSILPPANATFSVAIMGDAGEAGSSLDKLKKSVQNEKITVIAMPGDNLYSGSYEKVWDSWKKDGMKFDITAIGNHADGYPEEVKYFAMPGEFYSLNKGGAKFIILNSDNKKNVNDQIAFLNREVISTMLPMKPPLM